LCAAAAVVAPNVMSNVEEQRAAAERIRKHRNQQVRPLLRSRQQFAAYELLVFELSGFDEQCTPRSLVF